MCPYFTLFSMLGTIEAQKIELWYYACIYSRFLLYNQVICMDNYVLLLLL